MSVEDFDLAQSLGHVSPNVREVLILILLPVGGIMYRNQARKVDTEAKRKTEPTSETTP